MAGFLYITEFAGIIWARNQSVQAPAANTIQAEQKLAFGDPSIQSDPFSPMTNFILFSTDAVCSIAFGYNPVATIFNSRMAADQERFYGVLPGMKIAVIENV